ncbi:Uncharacterized conserved protein [Phaffia rhodozyma]|uniref:General transcription and DNA repair factor IIH subunit TFB5 n=1 Tax=Phaffia rhodozyma TaxID=264483 RepID=A0A0F7SY16_PHARH|nr:Uncharacterized conserved protein [Phaffia rhodozyma]
MAIVTKATLITCDEAIKQILLFQNEKLPAQDQFIIADLDATHLVVKTGEIESIEEGLNIELEKNHFDPKTIVE